MSSVRWASFPPEQELVVRKNNLFLGLPSHTSIRFFVYSVFYSSYRFYILSASLAMTNMLTVGREAISPPVRPPTQLNIAL